MSIEDQFDVAAQDARAEAARRARLAQIALERVADEIALEQAATPCALGTGGAGGVVVNPGIPGSDVAEVPEVPGKVEQDPELPQDPAVAPPCCDNPEPHGHEGQGG